MDERDTARACIRELLGEMLNIDASIHDRCAAAETACKRAGLPWPPFPDCCSKCGSGNAESVSPCPGCGVIVCENCAEEEGVFCCDGKGAEPTR